jgi:hypothetical protein
MPLIDSPAPQEPQPVPGAKTLGDTSVEAVDRSIKMPPQLQEAYERVLLAGLKVMFDKQTHELALRQLAGEGPVAERLGKAIAGLLVLLFKQSNETMPPQVIIPAGTSLLVRAADFLNQSGVEAVSQEDLGEAMAVMVEAVLTKFGVDPQQLLNSYQQPAAGPGLIEGAQAPQPQGAPA